MLIKNCYILSTLILSSTAAIAGELNPSAGPASTSSYTLQDICNRLDSGTDGTKQNFTEPSSGPSPTGCTLNEMMHKAPEKDIANAAKPDEVVKGKKYWGLGEDGNWGLKTGTNALIVTCEGTMNGRRWCDNGDGTVTDMTTGLVWLKKADWGGELPFACPLGISICETIFGRVSKLKNGSRNSGLKDGSIEGEWRIPTKIELEKLINNPEGVSSNQMRAFTDVQTLYYWSSTEYADDSGGAWGVFLYSGNVSIIDQRYPYYVWPVRSRH